MVDQPAPTRPGEELDLLKLNAYLQEKQAGIGPITEQRQFRADIPILLILKGNGKGLHPSGDLLLVQPSNRA